MGITIHEADVERDLELMRATHGANRPRSVPIERFRWLYLNNPDGRARAWFAIDGRSGTVAGFTAVFPRRIRVAGAERDETAWNCGDFSIHQPYRTGGAAVKLRRAARDAVDRGDSPFLYAHPNDRMLPVHMRAGHQPLARMVRYAKVLRTASGLGVVDALAEGMLRAAGRELFVGRRFDIEARVECPGNEDLDRLYAAVAPSLGTALVRDARYLDWRFRRNPVQTTEWISARLSGRLCGYLVFTVQDDVAQIVDWIAESGSARDRIFLALFHEARRRRLRRASLIALETHPDLPRLAELGFFKRPDSSTAVTYAPNGYERRAAVQSPAAWYMTVGDRDV